MGKNRSVGKRHTKGLGGPGFGPRAACCTPLLYAKNRGTANCWQS